MTLLRNLAIPVLLFLSGTVVAQGSLEPSAPPGPTMKTLDQVEARTPVSAPGDISSPGSYYLTNNISGNIRITADNVDLDLNGFTISTGVGNHIINVGSHQHIRIHNGDLLNGTSYGVLGINSGYIHLHDLNLVSMVNECVNFESITGPIYLERVHCQESQRTGFYIVQSGTAPLYVQIRDSSVFDSNLDTNVTSPAILVAHIGTGEIHAVITGNRVINNRTTGFSVEGQYGPAETYGQVTDNLAQGGTTGFVINGDFLLARNMAVGNDTNYSIANNTKAAPRKGLDENPGAWDNISE